MLENSPNFIARYDLELRRVYLDPAIEQLFTDPQQTIQGKTPVELSPEDDRQLYIEHMQKAIETASEVTLQASFQTAEGEMHWAQIRFVPELTAQEKWCLS